MRVNRWIVLGQVADSATSKVVNRRGEGVELDIDLGVVGALIVCRPFNVVGTIGATGFSLGSHFVAIVGAVVSLTVWLTV